MPIERAELWYITIAESIDTRDWEQGVTADKIIREVMDEKNNGLGNIGSAARWRR